MYCLGDRSLCGFLASLQEVARIGYSLKALQLLPPRAWVVTYLKAATAAVHSTEAAALSAPLRPVPPLTPREAADLLSGAAHCTAPWHKLLGAAEGDAADGLGLQRPGRKAPLPVSPLREAPTDSRVRPPPPPASAVSAAYQKGEEDQSVDSSGESEHMVHTLGMLTPPPITDDDIMSDNFLDSEEGVAVGRTSERTSSAEEASSVLSTASQLATRSEAMLLSLSRRMSASDLSRSLEAHWRLGSPVSGQILAVVQSRGAELLSRCTPRQGTLILQAMVYSSTRPSSPWVQAFLSWSGPRLRDEFSPPLLVHTLRSLARLGLRPGWEWMSAWLEAASTRLHLCNTSLCSQVAP